MNAKGMMEFGDWLKRRSMDESWITVAQHDVTERGGWEVDLFMTSVLAPQGSDEALLADSRWLADDDFGKAEVGADGDWIEVQTEDRVGKNGDVRIEPFTFLRSWNDARPGGFEIIQNFILFYNLHFDAEDGKYVAVDGAGEIMDVIKLRNEKTRQKIEIRARFLQNYLACRNRVLVRQHDNQIHVDRTPAELGIDPFMGRKLDDSGYSFDLTVSDYGLTDKRQAIGLLNGKDLVRPFDKCQDILGWPEGNSEFIIGVDDHGDNVTASCSRGDGQAVLAPVYFKREVLKKYYDTSNYKVERRRVSCSTWSIAKYTNKADLVCVLLCDLARLPANEQRHWRNYNVPPEVGDPDEPFVDSDTVAYRFRKSLRVFQRRFEGKFGFRLFLPLSDDDAYKEDGIRVPLNDDPGEFEGQIQNLAILLPDSINRKKLEQKMASLLSDPARLGSISKEQLGRLNSRYGVKGKDKPERIPMLEDFLLCESLPTTIVSHLRKIQDLRSSGVAHRKGSKYARNADKYDLSGAGGKKFIRKLLVDMASTFYDSGSLQSGIRKGIDPRMQATRSTDNSVPAPRHAEARAAGEHGEPANDGPPGARRVVDLNIPEREDTRNEFKETFSLAVKGGSSQDVKMEAAVAAFTNADGGRLFVGVNDSGKQSGLERDMKKYGSTDKLELAIRDFVNSKLGGTAQMEFGFSGEDYLVIEVAKSRRRWVYVDGAFYVREGNRSRRMNPQETAEYQEERRPA